MVNNGEEVHQESIIKIMAELRKEGYRVFNVRGRKVPDAIAIKGDEVIAIESLIGSSAGYGDRKVRLYMEMGFDDVFVFGSNKSGKLRFNNSDWLAGLYSKNSEVCKRIMSALSGFKVEDIQETESPFI